MALAKSRRQRATVSMSCWASLGSTSPTRALCKFFRRRADSHHADVLEFCLDGRIAQCGDRIDVDFLNDLARRPGWNEEREPSRHVEVGDAGLRNGRQLRRQLTPLRGGHRKSANLAAPDLLE